MPVQHKFRPQHLALAIALALGFTEFAQAQEPVTEPAPPTSKSAQTLIKELDAFAKTATSHSIKNTEDWGKLELGDADEVVRVLTPQAFNGVLEGGAGENLLQLEAAKGGTLGESRQFQRLDVKKGTWTLTGSGDFSTGALVRAKAALNNEGHIAGDAWVQGSLSNSGSIDGRVDIYEQATFSGRGSVGALNVMGHMLVNRAQGAPTVKGDMDLAETAVLSYEVHPDGSSETIKVDGTARLGNATLKVVGVGDDFPQTSEYTIIEASKVEGKFGHVESNLAFMDAHANYEKSRVGLTYARNEVPFEEVATDKNAKEFGRSIVTTEAVPTELNSSKTPNAAIKALLGTTTTTAPLAMELLTGDSNANLAKTTLNSITPVSASMLSAMRQLDSAGNSDNQKNAPRLAAGSKDNGRVWLQALGHGGKLDRDFQDLKYSTEGLVLGADWGVGEHWHLGMIGGKSSTRMDSRQLDGDLDSWHLGAYALRQSGPVALRLGATFSNHDGSTKREVSFYRFSDRPKGRYDANTQQAFAEVGYNLGRGNVSFEPFASVGYQRYQRDSFTEKGGAAALKVHGQSNENLNSTFGLRLAQINGLDNGMQLTPRFSAGWKHTYGELDSYTRQRLITGGRDYTVYGAPLDRDSLLIDAGLDLRVSTNNTLGVSLNGETGSDGRSYGVTGQWRMAF
ncbi:autotransporter outer membrane beta-barrel domain-containing protein [Pseudomonas sp. MAG733B]|uniref:autotransporter outer membrane beta-barrel domain-containing protein n=1 Tax=Pseudomonas sp. MAG733B TaxID=3122079 RepID=UPI0030CEBC62